MDRSTRLTTLKPGYIVGPNGCVTVTPESTIMPTEVVVEHMKNQLSAAFDPLLNLQEPNEQLIADIHAQLDGEVRNQFMVTNLLRDILSPYTADIRDGILSKLSAWAKYIQPRCDELSAMGTVLIETLNKCGSRGDIGDYIHDNGLLLALELSYMCVPDSDLYLSNFKQILFVLKESSVLYNDRLKHICAFGAVLETLSQLSDAHWIQGGEDIKQVRRLTFKMKEFHFLIEKLTNQFKHGHTLLATATRDDYLGNVGQSGWIALCAIEQLKAESILKIQQIFKNDIVPMSDWLSACVEACMYCICVLYFCIIFVYCFFILFFCIVFVYYFYTYWIYKFVFNDSSNPI